MKIGLTRPVSAIHGTVLEQPCNVIYITGEPGSHVAK